jgi:antitoxin (DNA-binding transcriptional repressor) of toxin-antitoxin stability system
MTELRLNIRSLTDRLRAGETIVVESYGVPVAVMVRPDLASRMRELHAANGHGRCGECFQPAPCRTAQLFDRPETP